MSLHDIQVKIYQLKQFCEQAKLQLSNGENNLRNLSKMIAFQTGPSRTGQEAAQTSNLAAKELQECIQSILKLEKELDTYIQQITS